MQIEALRLLCSLLPDDHRRVLQQLLDMLHTIAVHANAVSRNDRRSYTVIQRQRLRLQPLSR